MKGKNLETSKLDAMDLLRESLSSGFWRVSSQLVQMKIDMEELKILINEVALDEPVDILDYKISSYKLELTVRVVNILRFNALRRIVTIRDLIKWSAADLRSLDGFGEKCLREIRDELARFGLKLKWD